jgi:NitT/TauT family transport system ATP-binding protein
VQLEAVGKRFANGYVALESFSLALRPGQFTSLIGPSGCGKSTVLTLMAGLSQPTAGRLDWGPAGKPDIGFVFQEPTLMPWATVAQNVALPFTLTGRKAAMERACEEHLAKVGLSGFADAYPRQLSGGMKMRASIARALASRPALLLLDEPFGALDEITRFDLIDQLLALWLGQTFTTLFVTHSITESVFMSQRVVVMGGRPGKVLADITIDEPYPRLPALRAEARYAAWCGEVLDALRGAA